MTQRSAENDHLALHWEFPGGKIEPGESPRQSLARELREELGIGAEAGELVETITHAYPGKTVRLRFFLTTITEGEPRPIECAGIRWVTPAEMRTLLIPEADLPLVDTLDRMTGDRPL